MKNINKNYIFLSLILLIVSATFIFGFILIPKSQATAGQKVYGWAWSENIGWISLNSCTDPSISSSCSGADYGVTYDTSGVLSGYAWSPNIGWIKFGGLSDFPVLTGSSNTNAFMLMTGVDTGQFYGWARACAGTINGDCSSMTSRTDGWDGWISLDSKGTNPYTIKFNPNSGVAIPPAFAWGSSVVGWIDFSGVKITPPIVIPPATIVSFSGPSCVFNSNPNASFSWSTIGMASCSIFENDVSVFDIPSGSLSSGTTSLNVSSSGLSFYLRCLDPSSTSYTSNTIVVAKQASCNTTSEDKTPGFTER